MPKVAPITRNAEAETLAANPIVQFTDVELKGKIYKLCWDFHAIAIAEELTDQDLLLRNEPSRITAKQLRGMLYAGLLRAHPEITLDEVTDLITFKNAPNIADALTKAWIHSNKEPEKNESEAGESSAGQQ